MSNPTPRHRPRHHRFLSWIAAMSVAVLLVGVGAVGGLLMGGGELSGIDALRQSISQAVNSNDPATAQSQNDSQSQGDGQSQNGWGSDGFGQSYGNSQDGQGSEAQGSEGQYADGSDSSAAGTTTVATPQQSEGVVVVEADLSSQSAIAAGTGMVLTSNGLVLTNNHVVSGSTAVRVTIPSSGATYTATIVGTDAADDVAVLKLAGASDLSTVTVDDDNDLSTGDTVIGVGNAGGTGTLVAATGTVTALNQQVTTEAEPGAASESLSGLIATNAAIRSGDSGGPLQDAEGEVVGMDTAAGTGQVPTGYAIPISTALSVAKEIVSDAGGSLQLAA